MPLARGHAEALLPLIERVMARVDGGFSSLSRVAVTVGPGSYTGLRVGLSAARAVGLAAGIPVVGVTTLSALLAPQLALDGEALIVAAIDARHGALYLQAMSVAEGVVIPPRHLSIAEAVTLLGHRRTIITGTGAAALASAAEAAGLPVEIAATGAPQIAWVASLGLVADPAQALPRPLYCEARTLGLKTMPGSRGHESAALPVLGPRLVVGMVGRLGRDALRRALRDAGQAAALEACMPPPSPVPGRPMNSSGCCASARPRRMPCGAAAR